MKFFSSLVGPAVATPPVPDKILADLPRGEEGRRRNESHLPRTYFEKPEALAQIGFKEHSSDIFLGVVNGHTELIEREKDGRSEYRTTGGVAVGLRDDRHLTTIAGSRSGKGRSAIIPNLLSYGGSVLIIDPKGENASITADYRAKVLKQNVHVLDPFAITGESCAEYRKRFNPLSLLSLASRTLVEDAGLIADALIVPSGGNDTHWDESSKALILGVVLHVLNSGEFRSAEHTLVTVADLIAGQRQGIKELLSDMADNSCLEGRIKAAAQVVGDMGENERGSVLSSARKNLRFLQYDAMRDNLSGHDFELPDITESNTTIYLVLPAMRLGTCSQWLRLFVNLILMVAESAEQKPKIPVLMILDEFAILGRLQEMERAIGQIAGFGLRIWTILQDLTQLQAIYKDRWETFMGNSGIIQCFGNVDLCTSEWISKYLDKTTITVTDTGSTTADQKHTQGSTGQNERQQTQEVLTAAEVRKHFARDNPVNRQLVLVPGKRPYALQRVNYDQHEMFIGRFGIW